MSSASFASVSASAPCRVDLAGGTLDLWPLAQLVEGAVTLSAAIDLRAHCRLQAAPSGWTFASRDGGEEVHLEELPPRPERCVPAALALAATIAGHLHLPPARVETWSEAGRGSGLGGSSALAIALLGAMAHACRRSLSDGEAVAVACDLETRILGLPAGTQDHWAARCGGVSVLHHEPGGTRREALPHAAAVLEGALVLADTGVAHHSGMNNWTVFRAFLDGDADVRAALQGVADAARDMEAALRPAAGSGDPVRAAARALDAEWEARRRLSPAVTSPEVEAVVGAARSAGGAAKVCGAGGGGTVACLPLASNGRATLAEAVRATGARVLPVRLTERGLEVREEGR